MVSRRFIFITLAIFTLSLTGCVKKLDNGSLLTLKGSIDVDVFSGNEIFQSSLYIVGSVDYIPTTVDGEELEPRTRYFYKKYQNRIELDSDGNYELDILVEDFERRLDPIKSIEMVKVKLSILKEYAGNTTSHPLNFDNNGITESQTSGAYIVNAQKMILQ